MKRYFDMAEKRCVVELNLTASSPVAMASAEDLGEEFKTPMREITKDEFKKLQRKYLK